MDAKERKNYERMVDSMTRKPAEEEPKPTPRDAMLSLGDELRSEWASEEPVRRERERQMWDSVGRKP
jgi:hypothetical protein